jgi:uncharacterized membrane protein
MPDKSARRNVAHEELVDAFEELGWDSPSTIWTAALKKLALPKRLVTVDLKSVDRASHRLLDECRRAFRRGVRSAKKNQPAITRLARRTAKQKSV